MSDKPAGFQPLDISELNDLRRRVVNDREVTDEEIAAAIHTLRLMNRKTRAEKKPSSSTKKVETVSLDDLL